MNLKALLDEAKNSLAVLRHNLLLNNGVNVIHCFFEGQTDESFYGTHIRLHLKAEKKMISHFCGNKESVYKAFSEISTKIQPPSLGLFFVDKDLDDLIPIQRTVNPAIYVTNTYSIENYLADASVIERAIAEIYRLGSGHAACIAISQAYITEYRKCTAFFTQLTAWILFHRREGNRPNLNNIKLEQICQINQEFEFSAKTLGIAIPLLDKWTKVTTPEDYLSTHHTILEVELSNHSAESILRGKFVLWFVVIFLKVVKNKIVSHPPTRNISTEISMKTALDLLGPRCTTPPSLDRYLAMHL